MGNIISSSNMAANEKSPFSDEMLNQFRQQGDPLADEVINVLDRQKTYLLFSLNAQYIAFFTIEVLYNTGSYQYTNIIVLG